MNFLLFLITFTSAVFSFANSQVAVQRTPGSSYKDYVTHLELSHASSFVDAFQELSNLSDSEDPSIQACIDKKSKPSCLQAIKDLTRLPLNSQRREILFSILELQRKDVFLASFAQSLWETDSELAKNFPETYRNSESPKRSQLEAKAFLKLINSKFEFGDWILLKNGEPVELNSTKVNSAEVSQWAFVSNSYKPIVLVSTLAKFAADFAKNIEPFIKAKSCVEAQSMDFDKWGLMNVDVFISNHCIVTDSKLPPPPTSATHLTEGPPAAMPAPNVKSKGWMWTALAVVTLGAASSLRGKNISVSLPSFH